MTESLSSSIESNAIVAIQAWSIWPGIKISGSDTLTWISSCIPSELMNVVMRACIPDSEVDSQISKVQEMFSKNGVPASWFVGPSSKPRNLANFLERRKFNPVGRLTGMALSLEQTKRGMPFDQKVSVIEVVSQQSLLKWVELQKQVFKFNEPTCVALAKMYSVIGLGPTSCWRHFIATRDGDPVSSCSVFFLPPFASISNVGTLIHARGQGMGTSITNHCLAVARSRRCDYVTLISVERAVELYTRLGFASHWNADLYRFPV